jgi:hypothetical protein
MPLFVAKEVEGVTVKEEGDIAHVTFVGGAGDDHHVISLL